MVLYCNGPFGQEQAPRRRACRPASPMSAATSSELQSGGARRGDADRAGQLPACPPGGSDRRDLRRADRWGVRGRHARGREHLPKEEVVKAKDDGRLPMEDHNTRIVVFADSAATARAAAEEIAKNAFHNVAFCADLFCGTQVALKYVHSPPALGRLGKAAPQIAGALSAPARSLMPMPTLSGPPLRTRDRRANIRLQLGRTDGLLSA